MGSDARDKRLECCFFSSRRRHTRYWRDWSSDVCSSDLAEVRPRERRATLGPPRREVVGDAEAVEAGLLRRLRLLDHVLGQELLAGGGEPVLGQIGRASCRERV